MCPAAARGRSVFVKNVGTSSKSYPTALTLCCLNEKRWQSISTKLSQPINGSVAVWILDGMLVKPRQWRLYAIEIVDEYHCDGPLAIGWENSRHTREEWGHDVTETQREDSRILRTEGQIFHSTQTETRRMIHITQQNVSNPPSFLIHCSFSNAANTPLLEMKVFIINDL